MTPISENFMINQRFNSSTLYIGINLSQTEPHTTIPLIMEKLVAATLEARTDYGVSQSPLYLDEFPLQD
jgi:hypothetical protein